MSARFWPTLCAGYFAAFAFAASAHAQTEAEAVYAQRHFERGNELLAQGDAEAALQSFQRSYALSQSPNAMLYIGRCFRALQRYPEAAESFDVAALTGRLRGAEEPRYLETSRAAESEREALAPRIGTVVIASAGLPEGARVRVAGREIGAERFDLPIPVSPGEVEVMATDSDAPIRRVVSVGAGDEVEVRLGVPLDPSEIELPDEQDRPTDIGPPSLSRRRGWLATGIVSTALGIAGVSVGAGYAAAADRRFDALSAQCGGACPPERAAEIDEGRRFDRVANGALAVGGVLLALGATALIVWLLRDRSPPGSSAAIHF